MAITPDDKDWTWVTNRTCNFCGFDPGAVTRDELAARIEASSEGWRERLAQPDVADRPNDHTWSPLEYGAHIRDVHAVMQERLELMLAQQPAHFANWDQDAASTGYADEDPAVVADRIEANAATHAAAFSAVGDDEWTREGLRSNGSAFTVWTFGLYALHDLEHHRVDVGMPARA